MATRRSARRSTATQPFSPTSEAKRPQLKSRATPRRTAPSRVSKSRSPSPAAPRRSPSPAFSAASLNADSYVTPEEFSSSPTVEWEPSILGLPITDLLSVAICAFLGGHYVYTNNDKPSGIALHATAAAAAWLTAFGGGLVCHTILTFATMGETKDPAGYLRGAFASGTLGFQQKRAIIAALVGFAVSVPIGHSYDAESMNKHIYLLMDCVNWGILVAWAASKLAVLAKDVPAPSPLVLLIIAFPAGYAYCAAGGMTRNLLFSAVFTSSVDMPTNLQPVVAVPMAFGFAAYAVILQLVQNVLPPIPSLDVLLGVPTVAYIFFIASTHLQDQSWDTPIKIPQLSMMQLLNSGGDVTEMIGAPTPHPPVTVLVTPLLVYLVAGLRR